MIKGLTVNNIKAIKIDKKAVHQIVKAARNDLNFSVDALAINFIDKDLIKDINIEYLDHHFTTDIITFNYTGDTENLDGEIYISYCDALANARKFKVSLDNELMRLVFHGILHMVGYDDKEPAMKKKMKKVENQLVESYNNLSHNLIVYDDKNC